GLKGQHHLHSLRACLDRSLTFWQPAYSSIGLNLAGDEHDNAASIGPVRRALEGGCAFDRKDVVGSRGGRVHDPNPAAAGHGWDLEVERLPVRVEDHVHVRLAVETTEREREYP